MTDGVDAGDKPLPRGLSDGSITISNSNGADDVTIGELSSDRWVLNGRDKLFFETFALRSGAGDVRIADNPLSNPDASIEEPFPDSGRPGEAYSAVVGFDDVGGSPLEVTRTVRRDERDPAFTVDYEVRNPSGSDGPVSDVRLFQYVDYDIAGFSDDSAEYERSTGLLYIRDGEDGAVAGFASPTQNPINYDVTAFIRGYDLLLSGDLRNRERAGGGELGLLDPIGILEWSLGTIAPGESASLRVRFAGGSTVEKVRQLVTDVGEETFIPSVKPVQVVADSRLQTVERASSIDVLSLGDRLFELSDPPLIPGKRTTFLIGLDGPDPRRIPALRDDDLSIRIDVDDPDGSRRESFSLSNDDVFRLLSTDPTESVQGAVETWTNFVDSRLPTTTLETLTPETTITVEVVADVDGDGEGELDTEPTELAAGSEFQVGDPSPLNVAVVEMVDNAGGGNFGDPATGRLRTGNGRTPEEQLQANVDGIRSYLSARYPTGSVTVEVVGPIQADFSGVRDNPFDDDFTIDLHNAYDAVAGSDSAELGGFDEVVLLAPDGPEDGNDYFEYRGRGGEGDDTFISGTHLSDSPSGTQPPAASVVLANYGTVGVDPDSTGFEGTASAAAHELVHHFLGSDLYPERLAQEGENGDPDTLDNEAPNEAHARGYADPVGTDAGDSSGPAVLSTKFRYGVVGGRTPILDSSSLMSYDGNEEVIDSFAYRELLSVAEDAWAPVEPVVSSGGLLGSAAGGGWRPDASIAGSGRAEQLAPVGADPTTVLSMVGRATDDGIDILETSVRSGFPSAAGGTLELAVTDASGTTLDARTVGTDLELPNGEVLGGSFIAIVPFPEAAASVSLTDTDRTVSTELNPHTRPLRDLFDRIPAAAFARGRDRDGVLSALGDDLDVVERQLDRGQYGQASETLRGVRRRLGDALRDDYATPFLRQPARGEALAAVSDRASRVRRIADETRADQYGSLYRDDAIGSQGRVVTTVAEQENTDPEAKAGVMVRNDVRGTGESAGYVVCAVTPEDGFVMEWDADGDGFLDTTRRAGTTEYPCRLELRRDGTEFTGAYSVDGESWIDIASTTLSDVDDDQDVGMFATSATPDATSKVVFDDFDVA